MIRKKVADQQSSQLTQGDSLATTARPGHFCIKYFYVYNIYVLTTLIRNKYFFVSKY